MLTAKAAGTLILALAVKVTPLGLMRKKLGAPDTAFRVMVPSMVEA